MIIRYKKEAWKLYVWLAGVSLYISCVTFGGGYVVIPLIRKSYVEKKGLFSEEDLMDMAAVAQSSPGAIAINLSGLCGYKVAGIWGTIICCLAAVTPPLVILSIVSVFYEAFRSNLVIAALLKGMEAGVAAIMLDFIINLWLPIIRKKDFLLTILVPAAFISSYFLNVHVAIILIVCVVFVVGRGIAIHKKVFSNEQNS